MRPFQWLLTISGGVAGLCVLVGAAFPGAETALVLTGAVEAREVDVPSEAAGRIQSVLVEEGGSIEAGAPVALLDGREAEAEVRRIEARMAADQARVALLRAGARAVDLEVERSRLAEADIQSAAARARAERLERLEVRGSVSAAEVEDNRFSAALTAQRVITTHRTLAALEEGARPEEVRAAEARLAETVAELEVARARLARMRIAAPLAGTVLSRHFEPGEFVTAGAPLVTIVDLSDMWVELSVDSGLHRRIALGASVEVRPEGAPTPSCAGTISHIADRHRFTPAPAITRDARSRLCFRTKVRIASPPAWIKPGMFVDVILRLPGGAE